MSEGWGAARDTQGDLKSRQNTAEPGCCWGPALCGGRPRQAGFWGSRSLPGLGLLAGSPKVQKHFTKITPTPPSLSAKKKNPNKKPTHNKTPLDSRKIPNPAAFLKPRGQTPLLACGTSLLSLRGSGGRCAGAEPGAAAAT